MGEVPPAVVVDSLTVHRGRRAVLDGFDVTVAAGRLTGLLGPSGCGKSTLMRAIVGVQRVRGGTVTVLGQPAGSPVLRRRVAYVTQSPSVYSDLTVEQNLRYFARVLSADAGEHRRVMRAVGLTDHARALVGTLSGGEASRVSLAVGLIGRPEVLVLDEPTVGLDPVLRHELWGLFRALADQGATVLVSSHVMDEALRCDRLLLMRAGSLIADTSPAGLRESTGEQDPDTAFLALIERSKRLDDAEPP